MKSKTGTNGRIGGTVRKVWVGLAMFFSTNVIAVPNLVAPFAVDLVSDKHFLWDTIAITTYLINEGTTGTPTKTFDAIIITVQVDSFPIINPNHRILAGSSLQAGFFFTIKDTVIAPKGNFSVNTWCDPLLFFGEGGGEIVGNVRSQAYNFHPKIIRDTVVLYDTLVIHDTVKIVEKDTVIITLKDTIRVTVMDTIVKNDTIRVTIRDTVVRVDTIKYCPPTLLAKTSGGRFGLPIHSVVYNAIGSPVWSGMIPVGAYPPVRLKQGLHILVQGQRVHRFRVAHK